MDEINLRVKMQRLIDQELDDRYEGTCRLGEALGQRLSAAKRGKAQLSGLLAVAVAASRVSVLKDYIKNQASKEEGKEGDKDKERKKLWKSPFGDKLIDKAILDTLDELGKRARELAAEINGAPQAVKERAREVEIALQRGYIHSLVCAARYAGRDASVEEEE